MSHTSALRGPAPAIVLLVVAAVLSLTGSLSGPATGQAGITVNSPFPAPNAVVEAGIQPLGATVSGREGARLLLDDQDLGALSGDGVPDRVEAHLEPGIHRLAVVLDGREVRSWTVHAAGIATTAVGEDLVELGVAAAGPPATGRPVLLVNPDRLEAGLAAAPLAVATGALMLPTADQTVGPATLEAIVTVRQPGEEVMVLGGPDVVAVTVDDQLRAAGYVPVRIGSGPPSQIAAEAAAVSPVAEVYNRGGNPVVRPVLVAPARPLEVAVEAAAQAARNGAALVLAEDGTSSTGTISTATAAVIAERPEVWVAESSSPAVRAAVADAAAAGVTPGPPPAHQDPGIWITDAEADPAAALFAVRAARPGISVVVDPARAQDLVVGHQVDRVTTVGTAADPAEVAAWWVDGPAAPTIRTSVADSDGLQVVLESDRPIDEAFVYVTGDGVEWNGQTVVETTRVLWTAGPRPPLPPGADPPGSLTAVSVTAVVTADGSLRHVRHDVQAAATAPPSQSPEGFMVAAGTGPVVGTGPPHTYSVEVEPGTGLDVGAVASEAEAILSDPTRGWTARGAHSLQRVDSATAADIRIVVARPATVDRFCAAAGLATGGWLSCWDGRRAMLNLDRWNTGVAPFHTDVATYRQYLVNHETGHGLGYGHTGCPAAGAPAPVMMQQSKGLGGCSPNGWPYPQG